VERALAFIDLLGFSGMVRKNFDKARGILDDFYNISFRIIKSTPAIKGHLFSDSLMAYSEDKALLVNKICEIYRESFRKNTNYHNQGAFFLLPRGGISIGVVNIEGRREAPNVRKDFIVSPALVHSVEMERNIKGSRLLIAVKTGSEEEKQVTWNANIKSILYNQDFCFWNRYRYKDVLWFADLSKSSEERKNEIEGLLDIAINLVKANSDTNESLEHHIDTLRIGLLSYSHLFQATISLSLIDRLINEFIDDKHWKVWLTIFEMAMQSPDSWAVPGTGKFVDFYKKVCLSKNWAKLLEEINRPNNSYLKSVVENFIKELDINVVK